MSTDTSDTLVSPESNIAPNGDVIFVVGPEPRKLRVHSAILRYASKYFENMFGPHFAEGQDLGQNSPKEISMPDDNATANNEVPSRLKPDVMFHIAVAADKFDCAVAIKPSNSLWLKPDGVEDIVGLGYLMAAAYILDDATAFSEITLAMAMRHNESYLLLVRKIDCLLDYVPWERRNVLRTKLQQLLFEGSRDAGWYDDEKCTCAWASRHLLAHAKLQHDESLRPIDMHTISQALEKLDCIKDPAVPAPWAPCIRAHHDGPYYRVRRVNRLKEFQKEANGLCIDCVGGGGEGAEQACRIQHPRKAVSD
ncbi:hypothetical protein CC86DRAFT_426506 [Ophiobolus disseminans]|uniref:BTB domain-containing protein n=1 Tax=Ophiobolus disseminans TaxID=1469910 RepID=A0A6A6ZLS4_9PLEO|nr:hypothetical protein CC86DRAFT_426506 [Ophiobolus disseminans]